MRLYDLIEDEDLVTQNSYDVMILMCPECKALFSMKACGNRTLFPWFGYHPTDGNCKIMKDSWIQQNTKKVDDCVCTAQPERVTSKAQLDTVLKDRDIRA